MRNGSCKMLFVKFGTGVGGGDIAVVSSGWGSGWDRFRVGSVVQFRVCSSPG